MAIQLHPSLAVHAGAWLRRNIIDAYGLNVSEVAARLHVTRPAMSNLLNGKAGLSAEMAIRFEKAFGIPAETMMRMQAAYDLAQARKHEDELDIERIEMAA